MLLFLGFVNQTASQNAEEFGFERGDIVQEWLWDDDVDDSIREKIEELTGEELVDEDYDSAVDGVILWWRDGDDEDALSDTIVDAYAVLGNDGPLWVLTPKPGRPGAPSSSTVQSAAKTAGMNAATPLTVSSDWNGSLFSYVAKNGRFGCFATNGGWFGRRRRGVTIPLEEASTSYISYIVRGIIKRARQPTLDGPTANRGR